MAEDDQEFESEIDQALTDELKAKQQARIDAEAEELAGRTIKQTETQIGSALYKLDLHPPSRPRFEPSALHDLVRFPIPGQLWVVAAPTGIGKTTFLLSTIDGFLEQGVKVAMLGLEQEPDELRIAFACLRAGVPRAVAIENSWSEHERGADWFGRVQDHLLLQGEAPLASTLKLLPQRYINTEVLSEAVAEAMDWGAEILVVDHIHHIQTGGSFNEYKTLVQQCKKLAEDANLVALVAAQVGRRGSFGHALQRYMPPHLRDIEGGDILSQNANVVIGLYRPLIDPDTDDKRRAIRAAELGRADPSSVLRPWTMGVNVMKHRTRGEQEGKRVMLRLQDGRLLDPEPAFTAVDRPNLYESKREDEND
jgi:replicative DNA helicase